jgi:anthranilate phosphoribosyltransferase
MGDTLFDPESVGIRRVNRAEIQGGSPEENVRIMEELFSGNDTGPRADIVAVNAAAGLLVAGVVDDFASGVDAAKEAMTNGRAAAQITAVVDLSNEIAG